MGTRTTTMGLVVVALVATACGGTSQPGGTADDEPATTTPVGAWQLRDADPAIEVPADARITLTVEDDGGQLRAGGTAACNSYGGLLEATDGAWTLDELSWTEMGCDEPRMAAEAAYLDALLGVDAWEREGDMLTLSGSDTSLTFTQLSEVTPAVLTGTAWVLDGLVSGTGDDATVTSVAAGVEAAALRLEDDGSFTLFTGCRDFAGSWTTSGDELVLPSWGQTEDSRGVDQDGELTCGDAAEAQERAVLEVIEGGAVPVVEGDRLTLRSGASGLDFRAG